MGCCIQSKNSIVTGTSFQVKNKVKIQIIDQNVDTSGNNSKRNIKNEKCTSNHPSDKNIKKVKNVKKEKNENENDCQKKNNSFEKEEKMIINKKEKEENPKSSSTKQKKISNSMKNLKILAMNEITSTQKFFNFNKENINNI